MPINALAVGDKLPPATFIMNGDKKEVTTEQLCKGKVGHQPIGAEPLYSLSWASSIIPIHASNEHPSCLPFPVPSLP